VAIAAVAVVNARAERMTNMPALFRLAQMTLAARNLLPQFIWRPISPTSPGDYLCNNRHSFMQPDRRTDETRVKNVYNPAKSEFILEN